MSESTLQAQKNIVMMLRNLKALQLTNVTQRVQNEDTNDTIQ